MHEDILERGLLKKSIYIGTALVDMYAKCGMLAKAQELLEELPIRDIVAWNALIAGYAQVGKDNSVIDLFNRMTEDGIKPDLVTFTVVLNAFSHSGLVEEGQMIFDDIQSVYHVAPTLEHYTSMIDLFSRAGHFEKAARLIGKVSSSTEQLLLWLVLLGACLKWLNVDLGRWTFEKLIRLDEKCAQAYICMANIYAAVGLHAKANEIEVWRVNSGALHISDYCSWTDVDVNLYPIDNNDDHA